MGISGSSSSGGRAGESSFFFDLFIFFEGKILLAEKPRVLSEGKRNGFILMWTFGSVMNKIALEEVGSGNDAWGRSSSSLGGGGNKYCSCCALLACFAWSGFGLDFIFFFDARV